MPNPPGICEAVANLEAAQFHPALEGALWTVTLDSAICRIVMTDCPVYVREAPWP